MGNEKACKILSTSGILRWDVKYFKGAKKLKGLPRSLISAYKYVIWKAE